MLLALALCFSMSAAANFEIVSKAHEVALADLRLPGSTSGTLTFKSCGDCDYQTVRVTVATQYEVNGSAIDLEEFRKQVGKVGNRRDKTVTVLHHLASDTIKAIRIRF
jgi:hypothetical protein